MGIQLFMRRNIPSSRQQRDSSEDLLRVRTKYDVLLRNDTDNFRIRSIKNCVMHVTATT